MFCLPDPLDHLTIEPCHRTLATICSILGDYVGLEHVKYSLDKMWTKSLSRKKNRRRKKARDTCNTWHAHQYS